jgi:hypothetical protein
MVFVLCFLTVLLVDGQNFPVGPRSPPGFFRCLGENFSAQAYTILVFTDWHVIDGRFGFPKPTVARPFLNGATNAIVSLSEAETVSALEFLNASALLRRNKRGSTL